MTTEPTAAKRFLLGVDTGGTFTDAVVFEEASASVVATAKAPTTHDDLSVGIEDAISAVLRDGAVDPDRIDLVSLSTTLATNALVEGAGRPAALVAVGFSRDDLDRAGLPEAVGRDAVFHIAGGHDSHGVEVQPVDLATLRTSVDAGDFDAADAFAVTSQFSVRNPAHELAVAEVLRDTTGKPVTCSHELSSRLNGPKRAVTALLNARLISVTADLLTTLRSVIAEAGIDAPVMVVRGDGSLVAADFVAERPIETILSGPAASLVGAVHLSDQASAVVADIGGTTTDIAVVHHGVPARSGAGAVVGGHHTMVEAVDMWTVGLGGDSELWLPNDAAGTLSIGPRRGVPLSHLAASAPRRVVEVLRGQLRDELPRETDAVFVVRGHSGERAGLTREERSLCEQVADDGFVAAATLDRSARGRTSLARLISVGTLRTATFTPTDAAIVLGLLQPPDAGGDEAADAARLGAELMARRRDRYGHALAPEGLELCQAAIDLLCRRSSEAILRVVFDHAGLSGAEVDGALATAVLDQRQGRRDRSDVLRLDISSAVPIVAVGASAGSYYPAVADLLATSVDVPAHHEVANAVGAVAGRVRLERSVVVSAPRRGLYRVHSESEPQTFYSLEQALAHASEHLRAVLSREAAAAGAREHEIEQRWDERSVEVDGRELFVEGQMTMVATGRPRLR